MAKSRRPKPSRAAQSRKAAKERSEQIQFSNRLRSAARRPGHGTGTGIDDIWHPEAHQTEGESVDDPRRGKVCCRDCGQEIQLVELDNGKWQARNDDGLPHALTCGSDD